MHCRRRLTVSDITDHVTCPLCSGYLIDATAVVGCMHLFCRSCLLQHIQANDKKCPKCGLRDVEFRRDLMVQRIVYKLVPHLLTRELRRRQKFAGNETNASSAESRDLLPADMTSMIGLYADTDDISVCLQHVYSESAKQQLQTDELQRRYLLCPANTSIELVKKFVQSKFGLNSEKFQVELFHDGCLLDNCNSTLMDIAYSFNWDKSEPLTLDYVIVDCTFDEHVPPPPGVYVVSKSCGNRKRKMNESTCDGRQSDARQQAKSEPIDVVKVDSKNGSRNGGRNKLKPDGRNNKRQAENAADRSVQTTRVASSGKPYTRPAAAPTGELSKSTLSPDLETPSNANCHVSLKSDHQGTSSAYPATQAESDRSAAVDAVPTPAATNSLRGTGNSTEDDNCLSISTSVTVVISRRATAGSTSSTTEIGKDVVTVETGSSSSGCTTGSRMADSSSQQIVVNTKIPSVPGFAVTASTDISQRQSAGTRVLSTSSGPRNDEKRTVDTTLNVATSYDSGSPTSSQTDDVMKFSTPIGSPVSASAVDSSKRSNTKRKSLESVIRSLKPIAVVSATSSNTDKAATSAAAVAVTVSEPTDLSPSESSTAVDLSVKRKHVEPATDDGGQPQDLSAKCKRVVGCHGDSERSISLSQQPKAPFPAGTNASDRHPVKCGTRDRKATAAAGKYYPGLGVPSFGFDLPPTRECLWFDTRPIAAMTAAVAAVTRDKYFKATPIVGNGFDSPMELTRRLSRD